MASCALPYAGAVRPGRTTKRRECTRMCAALSNRVTACDAIIDVAQLITRNRRRAPVEQSVWEKTRDCLGNMRDLLLDIVCAMQYYRPIVRTERMARYGDRIGTVPAGAQSTQRQWVVAVSILDFEGKEAPMRFSSGPRRSASHPSWSMPQYRNMSEYDSARSMLPSFVVPFCCSSCCPFSCI